MRYEGIRYYPNRTLEFQLDKYIRRLTKANCDFNGRARHIRKQIERVQKLISRRLP